MSRVFIAINLPKSVKQELADLQDTVRSAFPDGAGQGIAKWVKPDNLHITLLFIGEVKDELLPPICEAAEKTLNKPGAGRLEKLKFKKICYGPTNKLPPRLIWVEIEKNEKLLQIAQALKQNLANAGLLPHIDNKPFSAHIALARVKAWQWNKIEPEERPNIEQGLDIGFEASSVDIMESVLRRSGPEYRVLKSIQLNPA